MSELDMIILNKIEKIETDISDIKIAITENTADMKHHISRTDALQDIVEDVTELVKPLYNDFISKKAIEDYKKSQRDKLIYHLKLPGYILTALVAIGTLITWFMRK